MHNRKPKIVDNRTEVEKLADQARARAANEAANEPLVPVHAQQHDTYEHDAKYGAERKRMVNRGGTPIRRWIAAGLLTESQQAAIAHCLNLWGIISGSGSLSCNLGKDGVRSASGLGHPREVEAREDLKRIRGYFPLRYWDCFENVARWDEPAGVAGSKLSVKKDSHETAARLTVQFVADTIYLRERLSYGGGLA